MARYNSSSATTTITGTATVTSPQSFTEFTGTAPYTVTLPSPVLCPGSSQTFYNATAGTVTISTPSGLFGGLGSSGASTQVIPTNTVVSITSDGTNYIVLSEDGSALVATTGSFTGNVTANGASATVSLTPQTVTIAPTGASTIDNVSIGATTKAAGAFTTLTANSAVTFTANTTSSSTGSGSLVVTGGVGVSGAVYAAGLYGPLTGTIQTAAQANITSTGSLTVPGFKINVPNSYSGANPANSGTTPAGVIGTITGTSYNQEINFGLNQSTTFWLQNTNKTAYNVNYPISLNPNGGGVGVGTVDPVGNLQVRGGSEFDSTTALNVTNSSNDYGRAQIRITGRIQAGNDGWGVNGRANLIFAANAAASFATPGAIGTDKFGLQYNMLSDMLGFVSSTTNTPPILSMAQNGNVGIGTTDFSAGYTFNVAKRARFNGMMLGNSDGSTASDNRIMLDWTNGSFAQIIAQQNVPLYLGVAGSAKVALDSGGHWLPLTNDTQNLGSATAAWANIYTNDLHLNNETKVNGNDVDGTTGNWTIQEGQEDLYIINNKTGKKYAFALKEIE